MRIPSTAVPLLVLSIAGAASADTVYLTNGKSFEGVVADVSASQVRIQMPGGEIRVPKASVERVQTGDSAFAEYLQRKQSLGNTAGAEQWLGLARWARSRGLDQGTREAALKAARLDPHLEGLSSILRGYGYVYDRDLDRYVSSDEEMGRRGYVHSGGQWITREELAAQRRARAELEAAEAARAASEAQRNLAQAELYDRLSGQAPAQPYPVDPSIGFGYPLGVVSGFFLPPGSFSRHPHHRMGSPGVPAHGSGHGSGHDSGRGGRSGGGGLNGLGNRVPGSLFPINPPGTRP